MTTHFPITGPLGNDADKIIDALNSRSEQIQQRADARNLVQKISFVALKLISLAAAVAAVACLPVAAFTFTVAPLTLAAACMAIAITSLGLCLLLDPRSPGELIIKDYWKQVFEALREGDGKKIIATCQELAKQKEARSASYTQSLGTTPSQEIEPFFHKTCLVGYLQVALEQLRAGLDDQAKSSAHMALSHFDASGFSAKVGKFIQSIADSPRQIQKWIQEQQVGNDLHALDALLTLAQ